jgi:hypothetical protein
VADLGQFRSANFVPGSSGWGLAPTGNAEFNAITLREGIVGTAALASPVLAVKDWADFDEVTLTTTSMTVLGQFSVIAPSWATTYTAVATGTCTIVQSQTTGAFNTYATQSSVSLGIDSDTAVSYGLTTFYSEVGVGPTTYSLTQICTPTTIQGGTVTGGTVDVRLSAKRDGGTTGATSHAKAQVVVLFTR